MISLYLKGIRRDLPTNSKMHHQKHKTCLQTCLAYGASPKYYKAYLTSESGQLKKKKKNMQNMKSSPSRASVATTRRALNK